LRPTASAGKLASVTDAPPAPLATSDAPRPPTRRQLWASLSPDERVWAFGRYVDRLPLGDRLEALKRALARVVAAGLAEGIGNVQARYGLTGKQVRDAMTSGRNISRSESIEHNAEETILALMAVGWRAKEIAELLRVGPRTVRAAKLRRVYKPVDAGAVRHADLDEPTIEQRIGLTGEKIANLNPKQARHPFACLYGLRGYTATTLSVAINAPVSVVLSWSKGRRNPKPHYLARMCQALKVTPDLLKRALAAGGEVPGRAATRQKERVRQKARDEARKARYGAPG